MGINMQQTLSEAIMQAIQREVEAEADRAAERARNIVLEKASAIAIEVFKMVDMNMLGENLVITIKDRRNG